MNPADPRPVIGFVAPLASGEAVVARPMLAAVRRGAALAAARHGIQVAVAARDDRRDPALAAELIDELAADPAVAGVVGPKNSGCASAAAPVAAAAGLPLVLPAATADDLCGRGGGWVFRLCATDRATAEAAAVLCGRLGVARLAVLADQTSYGVGLAAAVRAAADRAGVRVVAELDRADGVFHAMGEVEQADAIRAARAAGFGGVLLGAEGGPGAALAELAGPAAEGAWQLYAGTPASGAETVYAAEAEDAARLLTAAMLAPAPRAAEGDPRPAAGAAPAPRVAEGRAGIRAALAGARLDGASGPIAFGADGERLGASVSLWRIRAGRSEPVAEIPA